MHYVNISLISESVEDIPFTLPVYPKSNTDQSYYEPTGTTIANMRKSATSTINEYYDFKDGKVNDNFIIPPTRKNGLDVAEVDVIRKETIARANKKLNAEVKKATEKAEQKAISELLDNVSANGSSVADDKAGTEK